MEKNQNDKLIESFDKKCKEINVWYSLSNFSILDQQTKKKSPYDKNIIEVMMLAEHFYIFSNKFSSNVIDSSTQNDYFFSSPFYYEKDSNLLIKINLLICANARKTEKFYSFKNLMRQKIGYYKSIKKIGSFLIFTKKIVFVFLGLFLSPITWQEINSLLFDNEFDGYFVLDSLSPNINQNWIPSLTFERILVEFNNQKTYIPKEWELILIKKYGKYWNSKPKNIKKTTKFDWVYEYI